MHQPARWCKNPSIDSISDRTDYDDSSCDPPITVSALRFNIYDDDDEIHDSDTQTDPSPQLLRIKEFVDIDSDRKDDSMVPALLPRPPESDITIVNEVECSSPHSDPEIDMKALSMLHDMLSMRYEPYSSCPPTVQFDWCPKPCAATATTTTSIQKSSFKTCWIVTQK